MAEPFNPYHEWLGLSADVASPNYYQLLGLAEREPDLEKIAVAGDRALARVRSFRPGSHAKAWSELLDEIYAAKTCLLEPEVKAEYDERLARLSLAGSLGCQASPDDQQPIAAGPARAPVDVDRYPPGMAPPSARPATPASPKAEPTPIAAELVPDLPNVYASPAGVPTGEIAATAVPQWGGASTPAAYPPAYGAPMSAYAPGMYGPAQSGVPYGVMPAALAPAAHYGTAGPAALHPLSPDPMSPVSIPGISGPAAGTGSPQRIVGFVGATESPPMAKAYAPQPAAVPMGTDVAAQAEHALGPLPGSGPAIGGELARRREERSQQMLMLAAVAGGAAVLAALIIYVNLPPRASGEASSTLAQVNPHSDVPQPMPRTVESSLPTGRPTPIPAVTPMPVQPSPAPAPMPVSPMPEVSPMPSPEAPPPMAPMPEVKPETKPDPMPAPVPSPPQPPPMPAPILTPAPTLSPVEPAALGKALTLGRAALGEQNFEEADKFIAEAQSLARLPEHQAMVARLKEIAGYVRQFRRAVEAAAHSFEAAESFTVGNSTRVAVVEVLPDKIILRHTGQNKVYPYAELPPGLAVAIADHKFDGMDPMSRVIKGAFYAVSKGDQVALRQKAKTWWEEAQLGGVDLTHLMPFLTESYDLTGGASNP